MCERRLPGKTVASKPPTKHRSAGALLLFCTLCVAGCGVPVTDRQNFKDEILMEVRMAVHLQLLERGVVTKDKALIAAREQLKLEIEDGVLRKLQMLASGSGPKVVRASAAPAQPSAAGAVGKAEGRILRRAKGLPDCKVKLVRMVRSDGLLKVYREETEFDTTTDKNGKYTFEALPAGSYKLKWQMPGDTGWIRRLQYKPDITVEQGETAVVKTVETARGFVSG